MQFLTDLELNQISGGISAAWGFLAAGLAFIASIIYGYIHPNKCEA